MDLHDTYAFARTNTLILRHSPPEILQISGVDRLDFLNRICTNELGGLLPGEYKSTVLTDANARIVDIFQVLQRDDDALLLTSPNRGDLVRERLNSYVFFQDDVQIHPWDENQFQFWGVYGPSSLKIVQSATPSLAEFTSGEYQSHKDGFIILYENDHLHGFHMLLDPGDKPDPSWDESVQPVRMAAYQALRIEAGIPEAGKEITKERIPLEVGLDDMISFTKGCYIGQEIIARLDSRGGLARRMVGIRLAKPAPVGSQIFHGSSAIGALTSVAQSPRYGAIGLCIVKTKGFDLSRQAIVDEHKADFTSLPFE
ncbi:MAG: folate-binding protein YgfZ [Anaerolineales bacterium]